MNITTTAIYQTCVMTLDGDLDAAACEELTPAVEQMPGAWSRVVLDLTGVGYMDSSGVGLLVFLYKRLPHHQVSLHLICGEGQPRALLTLLHIDRTIACYPDSDSFWKENGERPTSSSSKKIIH